MNSERLHLVEMQFMSEFPGGFDNPVLVKEGKKHQVGRRQQQASEWFSESAFASPQVVAEHMAKNVTQSSLVSWFEKPAFKRLIEGLPGHVFSATKKGANSPLAILCFG
ncbi:MAG: hypothetical protein ACPHZA_16970 [Marinobacter adhaerens]|uniref:hypothetical protein n=1 Tax=Marinobacter adhaerens TaxID=1033846 RepID=UPI003C3FADDE